MDKWKIQIKDLEHQPTILHAEPNMEIMTKYVDEAVKELTRRCSIAEEQMIFEKSPDNVLIRIRDFCEYELKRRKGAS